MRSFANSGLRLLATRLASLLCAPLLQLKAALLERTGHGKDRRMVVLESLDLGNRRQLFLVSCDNHRFLIGAGAERVGNLVAVPEAAQNTDAHRAGAPPSQATRVPAQPAWRRTNAMPSGGPFGLQIVKRPEVLASNSTCNAGSQHGSETGGSRWH